MERRNVKFEEGEFFNKEADWSTSQPFLRNLLNSYNILVPDSERFIIRTVKKYVACCPENNLRKQIKTLFFQEGQHARETGKVYSWLEKKYRFKLFNKISYLLTYGWIEKVAPNKLLLAISSAVEHINTATSEYVLNNEQVLWDCPAKIRAIFYWHFAEEIEHKEVVFNVLKEVTSSNTVKNMGMWFAAAGFMGLLISGSVVLSFQDLTLFKKAFWVDLKKFLIHRDGLLRFWLSRTAQYHKSSFHPSQIDNLGLISQAIAKFNALITGFK